LTPKPGDKVSGLIEAFQHTHTGRRCATPRGAFGKCDSVSRRFQHFLSIHGVPAQVLQVSGATFSPSGVYQIIRRSAPPIAGLIGLGGGEAAG